IRHPLIREADEIHKVSTVRSEPKGAIDRYDPVAAYLRNGGDSHLRRFSGPVSRVHDDRGIHEELCRVSRGHLKVQIINPRYYCDARRRESMNRLVFGVL